MVFFFRRDKKGPFFFGKEGMVRGRGRSKKERLC